ncbi:transcription-repair coupling factor [Buchnera aphidicola]|uniref:transcription-repair coupling factor n=1 Tax=Buchnera aphidicola TaxID=9 RepID=UPI003BEF3352
MIKKIKYNFKKNIKQKYQLGNVNNLLKPIEYSFILEQYPGFVVLIASSHQEALHLKKSMTSLTDLKVIYLQDWQTLPFDRFSPHCEIISSRLSILYHLKNNEKGFLIVSISTLLQKICSSEYLTKESIYIYKSDKIYIDILFYQLQELGYKKVNKVYYPGEFNYNLSLIDIYPMGSSFPCRIHFLENHNIVRLQRFNIHNQRTFQNINSIIIMPRYEFPVHKNAINILYKNWKKYFNNELQIENIYQLNTTKFISGIEYWQPLFFKNKLSTLFDYFPKNTLIIYEDKIEEHANNFWNTILERYNLFFSSNHQIIAPKDLWMTLKQLLFFLNQHSSIKIIEHKIIEKNNSINVNIQNVPKLSNSFNIQQKINYLISLFNNFSGKIVFALQNKQYLNNILKFLKKNNINPQYSKNITHISLQKKHFYIFSNIYSSFIDKNKNLLLICEQDLLSILNNEIILPIVEKKIHNNIENNLFKLEINHPIVHLDHGIGRYQGLKTIEIANIKSEYLVISYAEEDKLYVPISYFYLITPYHAISQENIPLHKLGGSGWTKEKKKIYSTVYDHAVKLLDIYANRASKKGFSFKENKEKYQIFCQDFPFETTLDQKKVIMSVLNDMYRSSPMDRVICGDVGFGKTEIAMRAAFISVSNFKQVAILVPTTLLAQQHFKNFKKRFSNWSFSIEMLSRFKTKKEQKLIIKNTKIGKINILIGTHKILLKNIDWYDLGLLIIDEEHRFGVHHKEIIQESYSNIDILTLTATPIPRTLNMAMTGIKDLSIIANPPSHKLSIKTFVQEYNKKLIREAILREILRGGQVYYIYNKVKNIENIASQLSSLIPEAKIKIGHGKMHNLELKEVMNEFYQKKFNVLVCTTIIESGIDIPNVNTIIIENADHFGLSQLHQLRGRVGRSYQQSYAWLLIHNFKYITSDAKKRLEAFLLINDFGAGFSLANQDLEIRGVGELLGKEQSGHINTIGFNLYLKILKNTVKSIKNGHNPSLHELIKKQPEIELNIPILLPENYILDVNTRLYFYKKIVSANNMIEIKKLEYELSDRFGNIPNITKNLLSVSKIRLLSEKLGINSIKANNVGGFIEFNKINSINIEYLLKIFKEEPKIWKIEHSTKIKFVKNLQDEFIRIQWIIDLLKKFIKNM